MRRVSSNSHHQNPLFKEGLTSINRTFLQLRKGSKKREREYMSEGDNNCERETVILCIKLLPQQDQGK